jgi:pimeloyl-ACP methyl ester carboxylesterase
VTNSDLTVNALHVETQYGPVYVEDAGGGDPPVVLMHGFPDDHRIYDKLQPLLVPNRTVVFDWAGYGKSHRSADAPFTLEAHGAELESVLDALSIDQAVFVAHDASGPDAIAFAANRPERVAQLVLLNTTFGRRPSLRLPEMIHLLADPDFAPLADAMLGDDNQRLWLLQYTAARWGLDPLDPNGVATTSVLPQFFGDASQPDALSAIRTWTRRLFEALDAEDAMIAGNALHDIDAPVTLIFGEDDAYLSPALAAELGNLFTDAAVHLVGKASHWVQFDQPEAVAHLIRERLDR